MTQRIRAKLRDLFRQRGMQAGLSKYLSGSPVVARKLSPSEVSMMFKTGTRSIDIDTLDDVAAFFNLPVSDLLGIPSHSDLSASEQRMVFAFRLLNPSQQEHFLAIIETMSIHARRQRAADASPAGRSRGTHDADSQVPETEATIIARLERDLRSLTSAVESRRHAPEASHRRTGTP